MARYAEFTADLADRLTDVIARAEDAQVDLVQRIRGRVEEYAGDMEIPEIPGADRLPGAREVVQANFALAQRLLDAQRRYSMSLIDAISGKATKRKSRSKAKSKAKAKAKVRSGEKAEAKAETQPEANGEARREGATEAA